jgi:hypothetical protein
MIGNNQLIVLNTRRMKHYAVPPGPSLTQTYANRDIFFEIHIRQLTAAKQGDNRCPKIRPGRDYFLKRLGLSRILRLPFKRGAGIFGRSGAYAQGIKYEYQWQHKHSNYYERSHLMGPPGSIFVNSVQGFHEGSAGMNLGASFRNLGSSFHISQARQSPCIN